MSFAWLLSYSDRRSGDQCAGRSDLNAGDRRRGTATLRRPPSTAALTVDAIQSAAPAAAALRTARTIPS